MADVLTKLLAMRAELDGLIAALDKPAPAPAPTYLTAREFAARERICMARLRAYWACGMPNRRHGKAILINPVLADAWLAANLDAPAVKQAVQTALACARKGRQDAAA